MTGPMQRTSELHAHGDAALDLLAVVCTVPTGSPFLRHTRPVLVVPEGQEEGQVMPWASTVVLGGQGARHRAPRPQLKVATSGAAQGA